MGYEVLEKINIDLSDLGAGYGQTAVFLMKREPDAGEQPGKKLEN